MLVYHNITTQQPLLIFLPNTDGKIVEDNTNDDSIGDFIVLQLDSSSLLL